MTAQAALLELIRAGTAEVRELLAFTTVRCYLSQRVRCLGDNAPPMRGAKQPTTGPGSPALRDVRHQLDGPQGFMAVLSDSTIAVA